MNDLTQESSKEFLSTFGSSSGVQGSVSIPVYGVSADGGGGTESLKFKGNAKKEKNENYQKNTKMYIIN